MVTLSIGLFQHLSKIAVYGGHEDRSKMSRLEVRGLLIHYLFSIAFAVMHNPDVAIIQVRSILKSMRYKLLTCRWQSNDSMSFQTHCLAKCLHQ